MIIIGVTGGIGSGKSYVCSMLENRGIDVYYADTKAKELLVSDKELRSVVISLLGDNSYTSDGQLNREYIASVLFNPQNKKLYNKYNTEVHKAVMSDFKRFCSKRRDRGDKIAAIEAAILIESGFYKEVDYVLLITADMDLRIERAVKRDCVEHELIKQRIACQMDDCQRAEYAHFTIENNDNSNTESQLNVILERIICQ